MCLISLRYIKEVEDRIEDSLIKETIGEVIVLLIEIVVKAIEDMVEVEVIFREVTFREVIFEVDIIIEWTEVGKIGGHGDNLGQEKEKEEVGHHPSSRSGSRTSMNRDRIRCFKYREYDHFANECPNLVPDNSDRESDNARSVSLQLADNNTGLDMEQYLNI